MREKESASEDARKRKSKRAEMEEARIRTLEMGQIGPSRILCAPPHSPEYLSFVNTFCVTYQGNKEETRFKDIQQPEVTALTANLKVRSGSADASIVARELQVIMIVCRNEEHKACFVDAGCIPETLAAMSRFTAFPEVQIQGCKALINMGKDNDAKSQIGNNGGFQIITCAMEEWKDSDEVQEIGIWAIGSIVASNFQNKNTAGESGSIEVVLQALRSYPGNIALQQVGLWTLGSLAANHRENGNKIGKKGGISLVINAMKAFSDIPSLQEMVLSFVLLFFVACEYVYTRRTYV
jgi:general stress protein YciG